MSDEREQHAKKVDAWIAQNTSGLSQEKLLLIFGAAIGALQKRASVTLSEVTLVAILDRIIYKSKKQFPLLAALKNESKTISLQALLAKPNDLMTDELTDSFRFFLIELLTLLGNLTADILTKPLHQELLKTTAERAFSSAKAGTQHVKSNLNQEDL